MKNKDVVDQLHTSHKIILMRNPVFAPSYNRGDIIEIDRILYTGDRTRVYPKNCKNNYEYVYNDDFEIYI